MHRNLTHFVVRGLLCLLLVSSQALHAQANVIDKFKQDLEFFNRDDGVGRVVILTKNRKTLFADARGMASIELQVPLQLTHVFEIGSITKLFTAVAILQLAQTHQLALDDPITKYLPDISNSEVQLHHLLAHTSGLVDPINSPSFLANEIQHKVTLKQLLERFQNGHWQHKPGDTVHYTNVGYSILAAVIEKVSGQSYIDYVTQHIFKPAGMRSSGQVSFAITPGKVTGYTFDGSKARQHDLVDLAWGYGAADILSTVGDLAKFNQALMHGTLLKPKYVKQLFSPITVAGSSVTTSSYNASIVAIGKHKAYRMNGSTMGYSSHSLYIPDLDLYLVVLANSDGINRGGWVAPATVASKLIASYLDLSLPDYTRVSSDQVAAKRWLGNYRVNATTVRKLIFRDGEFFYQRNDDQLYKVIPLENHVFYFPDNLSYLKMLEKAGQQQQMHFYYTLSQQPEAGVKER